MLSALAIDNAKPREKPYKLSDGNGLHLLVNPNGSKLWRLRYRFGGKQLMLSLGLFPDVSLASARLKRDDARKLIAADKDPSLQRKLEKLAGVEAAKNTFGVIPRERLRSRPPGPATTLVPIGCLPRGHAARSATSGSILAHLNQPVREDREAQGTEHLLHN